MQVYSLFLSLGVMAGLLLAGWRAPKNEAMRYLDAGLGILFFTLVGSRAFSVAAAWSYYQTHPLEIVLVWLGGLSGVGALAGGLLGMIIIALMFKFPLGILADTFLPLSGTLAIAAWLGAWINGTAYGAPSATWLALPAHDEWGSLLNRVPVQPLGAILSLSVILLLDWASKRLPIKGTGAMLGLFGLSSVILGLSFLRADPAQTVSGLRLEAWGALGLMIISLLMLVVLLLGWNYRRRMSSVG